MTSTMPVNMFDDAQRDGCMKANESENWKRAIGIDISTVRTNEIAEYSASATEVHSCVSDMTCILFHLPLSPSKHLGWLHHGYIKDTFESSKESQTSLTDQWLEMLALQGLCNSCSGLAHSAVGGYPGSGHD